MAVYTVQCALSILGWKILTWRKEHKKSHLTWETPIPEELAAYLLIGEQAVGSVPVLCSAGLHPGEVAHEFGSEWMHDLKVDDTLIKKTKRGKSTYLTFRIAPKPGKFSRQERSVLSKLDAYGHLSYVVGFSDEWREVADEKDRGDWLACFDFRVFRCRSRGAMVAYHAVINSDSGGFIETGEQDVVHVDNAPLDLPDYWASIGMDGVEWLEEEVASANRCQKTWENDLRREIERTVRK